MRHRHLAVGRNEALEDARASVRVGRLDEETARSAHPPESSRPTLNSYCAEAINGAQKLNGVEARVARGKQLKQ